MTYFHRISGRGLIAFCHDLLMAGVSFLLAMYLRIGGTGYQVDPALLAEGFVAMAVIGGLIFWFSGLYRGVWRYASMDDLMAITRGVTLTMLVFLVVMFTWARMDQVPRSVPFINWFVLMALLGGPRFIYRFWKDRRIDLGALKAEERIPVLLVGASDGADQFIRGLRQGGDAVYHVVGILSERADRVGRTIRGAEVLGTVDDLERVASELRARGTAARRLILTKDEIKGAPVRDLLDRASRIGMTLARMPRMTDLRDADGERFEVRPVAVEDLLGRAQTPLDRAAMSRLIAGRKIAVTGAGGSIGAELVRQIAGLGPSALTLIENNEYALYKIDKEVAGLSPRLNRNAVIADVRDRERTLGLIRDLGPDLVFHAAALKHVPLVEANPGEGIRTNVGGTINVADACAAAGVSGMVLISTDKAVNPSSVMGATKRIAEMYCQALDLSTESNGCRFVTVRFGNVLGSTGSVVPLFQRQLEHGGPLTVTHPDMVRYFMTIREAVELVLEASAVGTTDNAADSRIFVLDMGEPVRIMDLARQMIRLAGYEPDTDIPIAITGVRPGEKLFEEVFHGGETLVQTEHPGLLLAAPRVVALAELKGQIDKLFESANGDDDRDIRPTIQSVVPEYHPTDSSTDAGQPQLT